MKLFNLILLLFIFQSCNVQQIPMTSLNQIDFSIFPHIVNKKGVYYLQFRINTANNRRSMMVNPIYSCIKNGKAYYFFSNPINKEEIGDLKERPLELDDFEDYAAKGEVYWLNKDLSEQQLEISYE